MRIKALSNASSRGYNGMTGLVRGREGKRWEVQVRGMGKGARERGGVCVCAKEGK